MRGHHDSGHSQGVRQRTTEEGPGAAERQQRHAARIYAACHADALQRARHHRGSDLDDPGSDFADVVRKRQGRQRTLGRGPVESNRIRERVLGIEPAEHEAGVGHSRLRAAPSVARGTWLRARAAGTHPKGAALVHRRDASAPGTYRLDQDGGQRERHPRDRLGAFRERDAAADEARIGARATHIEREEIVGFHVATDEPGAYDAAGRTRQRQTRRPMRRLRRRHRSSARRHDPQRPHTASPDHRRGLLQIRGHFRPQVRLGAGRTGAFVFAKHRQDFMTGGDRNVR